MKIFIDTNIFLSAALSEKGASRYIFKVADFDKTWHLITCDFVIEELSRNIVVKSDRKNTTYLQLANHKSLTITKDIPPNIFPGLNDVITKKDQPILSSAIYNKCDILCTLDRKDFFKTEVKKFANQYNLKIMEPKKVLETWRK